MGSNPGIRTKTGWIRVRIMCPRETTCLSVDCCFNELAIQKSNSACFLNTKQTPILLKIAHLSLNDGTITHTHPNSYYIVRLTGITTYRLFHKISVGITYN